MKLLARLWLRFRWWAAIKICPPIRVIIRVGKLVTPQRFATVKQYSYWCKLDPFFKFDITRHRRLVPNKTAMEIIDMATAAEGSEVAEMEEWRANPDFDEHFKPRIVEADILREALKGTPLEGLDQKPE